jgi:hypothetical protein
MRNRPEVFRIVALSESHSCASSVRPKLSLDFQQLGTEPAMKRVLGGLDGGPAQPSLFYGLLNEMIAVRRQHSRQVQKQRLWDERQGFRNRLPDLPLRVVRAKAQ